MSEYQKAKMPDYGDGPEPCDDCAIKDKRIAELEEEIKESRGLVRKLVYILQRSKPESYLDTAYFKNTLDAGYDYMRGENSKISEGDADD